MIKLDLFVSLDYESFLIRPGLLAPPPVCYSVGRRSGQELVWLGQEDARRRLRDLYSSDAIICGANLAFDDALTCHYFPELLPLLFEKYRKGEVFDVQIAQALDAVAKGCLFKDPRTFQPLRRKDGRPARYSLDLVTKQVLGREDAKEHAEYRLRYGELAALPPEQWPDPARMYPLDDARNTLEVATVQATGHENLGLVEAPALKERVTHLVLNMRAALALHLGSCWGLRTEERRVEELEKHVKQSRDKGRKELIEAGLVRLNGSKDTSAIKRRVVRAYGAEGKCTTCNGSGKVPSAKTHKPVCCDECDSTGLDVRGNPNIRFTEKGGVSTERVVLEDSGDPVLEGLVDYGLDAKMEETYGPFLRQGTKYPVNVRPNVLVESGRTSYDGLIQLLPRKGGARECFVARRKEFFPNLPPDWEDELWCSVDYAAVELSTLAQVCIWTVGFSNLAEAINADKDPHALFAADLMAVTYDEVRKRIKAGDPVMKDARQMSKAANFGFPGLMGAAKFVLTKRKEGLYLCVAARQAPVCDACGGEAGSDCRKCRGRGGVCGIERVFEYRGRAITPTCKACLDVAENLRRVYLTRWSEVPKYWRWVQEQPGIRFNEGGEDGDDTAFHWKGVIKSPGTGYVRGGLNASAGSNHCFQHLAAYAAKHALWKQTLEAYTDKSSPMYGSKLAVFAHDETIWAHKESRAHEAGFRQAEVQVAAAREFVPDVQIKAEPALMRRWWKAAEACYDAAGRLIPWEPEEKKGGPKQKEFYVRA